MAFSQARQQKLDPILASLKAIPGIDSVQQDDFDSFSISVFVWLKQVSKTRMAVRVSDTSRRIKKAMKESGVEYAVDDMPCKNGDEGYPTNRVGFTIYV